MENNCTIAKLCNITKKAVLLDSHNMKDEYIRDAMLQRNTSLDMTMHMRFQMNQLNVVKI